MDHTGIWDFYGCIYADGAEQCKIHIIHSLADDRIPFCEYFIIPYVMWYFFLIGTVIYFTISCLSKKEYYQTGTLGAGIHLFC